MSESYLSREERAALETSILLGQPPPAGTAILVSCGFNNWAEGVVAEYLGSESQEADAVVFVFERHLVDGRRVRNLVRIANYVSAGRGALGIRDSGRSWKLK